MKDAMRVLLVARGTNPTKRLLTPPSLTVATRVWVILEKDSGWTCILVLITSAGCVVVEAKRPAINPQGRDKWEGRLSTSMTVGE